MNRPLLLLAFFVLPFCLSASDYQLPPEPDSKINNATLLGIDSNNNGVRDDVERAIYSHYKSPIEHAAIMQRMKIFQKIFGDDNRVSHATLLQKEFTRSNDCILYLLASKNIDIPSHTYVKNIQINTKERLKVWLDYDKALSGGVYGSGPNDWLESACDFNVTEMLETVPGK